MCAINVKLLGSISSERLSRLFYEVFLRKIRAGLERSEPLSLGLGVSTKVANLDHTRFSVVLAKLRLFQIQPERRRQVRRESLAYDESEQSFGKTRRQL